MVDKACDEMAKIDAVGSSPNNSVFAPPITLVLEPTKNGGAVKEMLANNCGVVKEMPRPRLFPLDVLEVEEAHQVGFSPPEGFEDLLAISVLLAFVTVLYSRYLPLLCRRTPLVFSPKSLSSFAFDEKFLT
ncbi:hypothetical protein Nepgr_032686 [Nepenthes gracilis]|uniref:Uncharacterized protein n=1 Tax=Nepenthes gracilis TaxID=150966 RepID=A0AAD3TJ37_NEPGR|nr:hypothetical protein Nepgr_032686 [Nepenthes gracilis]